MSKRRRLHWETPPTATWLHLHKAPYCLPRDIRKKVYGYLTVHDWVLVQWAHGIECPIDWSNVLHFVRNNYMRVLEWISITEGWDILNHYRVTVTAVTYNHLHILQWLHNHDSMHYTTTVSKIAAYEGHIHILRWLRRKKYPFIHNVCEYAAKGGHLHVLKWLRINGYIWDAYIYAQAAKHGHLHIMQWALENKCPRNEYVYNDAAECGDVAMLQWLHDNDFAYHENNLVPCGRAVVRGHLKALQWFMAHDFAYDVENLYLFATRSGHLTILQWLHSNDYCMKTSTPILESIAHNHVYILQWFYAFYRKLTNPNVELYTAVKHGRIDIAKWLISQGAVITYDCVSIALKHNRLFILKMVT